MYYLKCILCNFRTAYKKITIQSKYMSFLFLAWWNHISVQPYWDHSTLKFRCSCFPVSEIIEVWTMLPSSRWGFWAVGTRKVWPVLWPLLSVCRLPGVRSVHTTCGIFGQQASYGGCSAFGARYVIPELHLRGFSHQSPGHSTQVRPSRAQWHLMKHWDAPWDTITRDQPEMFTASGAMASEWRHAKKRGFGWTDKILLTHRMLQWNLGSPKMIPPEESWDPTVVG